MTTHHTSGAADLPVITGKDRQFLHDNPNTDDLVAWAQDYAARAVALAAGQAVALAVDDKTAGHAMLWRQHCDKLDALVTYCPTCCQGFIAQKDISRDEVIFECGKTAGREAAKKLAAQQAGATDEAEVVCAVAYLDIGAGGYLDLEAALSDEAMQQLPKGRHALVIAGTYGIDGYTAASTPQSAPPPQAAPARVLEDAARWHWMAEYLVGTRTDLDDELIASATVDELNKLIDADLAASTARVAESVGRDADQIVKWSDRIQRAHPKSEPEFWPDALRVKYMADEISDLRATRPAPPAMDGGEDAARWKHVEQSDDFAVCRLDDGAWREVFAPDDVIDAARAAQKEG